MPNRADAEPRIQTHHEEYSVAGSTGAAIMREIRRKGPSHGLIGRAIAQTRYTLDYGYEVAIDSGRCHAAAPWVRLDITIVYPRLDGDVSGQLRRRFETFLQAARRHEAGHAELARQMAGAADAALGRASFPAGKECAGLKRAIDREIRRIFSAYEGRQRKYDRLEHRQGGPVEREVKALTGTVDRKHRRRGP